MLNPGTTDVSVSVQTIVAGVGRTAERVVTVSAGTMKVVQVPVPASRAELTLDVSSSTPSIAVAGFVTYTTRRGRAGPVSIVAGATLDARRSAFATPGPGASRTVRVVIENVSAAGAAVDISIGDVGHVKTTVPRDSVRVLTLGPGAQSAPLVVTSNTPVYAFRRLDESTGVSTVAALPAT